MQLKVLNRKFSVNLIYQAVYFHQRKHFTATKIKERTRKYDIT